MRYEGQAPRGRNKLSKADVCKQQHSSISVIVPAYNHANFLRERIETITKQSQKPAEIIFLDDGSTDGTLRVIMELMKTISYSNYILVNTQNSGSPFRQWKRGLDSATGDYIWIAEADDSSDLRFLERMLSALRIEPKTNFAFCYSLSLDNPHPGICSDQYKTFYEHYGRGLIGTSQYINSNQFLKKYLSVRNIIPNVSSVLWRTRHLRTVYDQLGDQAFKFRICGDWQFYVKSCAMSGMVYHDSRPMNYHRKHKNSVSTLIPIKQHFAEVLEVHRLVKRLCSQDTEVAKIILEDEQLLTGQWDLT
ncbi:glycosyltransferase [Methylobacterium sp. E-016]|uniref:glycosyltransferase family 2 protein n=1 Tax=Methylobacterium sp. E-016 TaxID=2836556 RepID=UPI001FB997C2|nr:glycosyltransferase family A protein [Methylobacterium sp. E-016]MCJ2078917.1 glycosyltransferase [Methylobacterium sp. E-016]